MITFERLLNGSNEPKGRRAEAGADVAERGRGCGNRVEGRQPMSQPRRLEGEAGRADDEQPDVEQDERHDRAQVRSSTATRLRRMG